LLIKLTTNSVSVRI